MGNAGDAVKAAADAVVASNEDAGVAEAIERFVMKRDTAFSAGKQ
jgi:hydroxymethylpyrimidine pyrophosphatase-like HAD family hydrolase